MLKIDDGYPICIISLSTPLCILVYYDNFSLFDPVWHSLRMCDYSVCVHVSVREEEAEQRRKKMLPRRKSLTLYYSILGVIFWAQK